MKNNHWQKQEWALFWEKFSKSQSQKSLLAPFYFSDLIFFALFFWIILKFILSKYIVNIFINCQQSFQW